MLFVRFNEYWVNIANIAVVAPATERNAMLYMTSKDQFVLPGISADQVIEKVSQALGNDPRIAEDVLHV